MVLFKCDWFNPTPNSGMIVHEAYKLVDINHRRRFNKYEPFVLAAQAAQVYYYPYPNKKRDRANWWAVSKVKPRLVIDMPEMSKSVTIPPFQEDDISVVRVEVQITDVPVNLVDLNAEEEDVDDEEYEEEEFEYETSSENGDEENALEETDDE